MVEDPGLVLTLALVLWRMNGRHGQVFPGWVANDRNVVPISPDLGLYQGLSQLQVLSWSLSEDEDKAARIHLLEKNFEALGDSLLLISSSRVPFKMRECQYA